MMKNVQISLIARNYADALIKLGQDGVISYDEILKSLDVIQEVLKNSNDLKIVIENPSISNEVKFSIITDVFKNNADLKIIDFLKILINKNKFNEFDKIVEAFRQNVNKINNIQVVEVISAIDLSEDLKKRVIDKLQNKLQKTIKADWTVDDKIIGGLVFKIDDDIIDSSLKTKLENLSKKIKG